MRWDVDGSSTPVSATAAGKHKIPTRDTADADARGLTWREGVAGVVSRVLKIENGGGAA
jgi:hypothetical protein